MSSPQVEHGYTRIADELLDALVLFPFSKRQLKVMLAIIRRTYGFGKKEDDITVTRLAEYTGLTRPHTSATLDELVAMNAVLKRDGVYGYVVGIQKDYSKWRRPETGHPVPKRDMSRNRTPPVPKRDGDRPETGHTINNPNRQSPIDSTLSGTPDEPPPPETPKATLTRERRAAARRVLDFLNEKTGKAYRPVEANLSMIEGRLKEGATEVECRQVIVRKRRDWSGDEKMEPYLRPATLFNRTKFAQYQGELVEPED